MIRTNNRNQCRIEELGNLCFMFCGTGGATCRDKKSESQEEGGGPGFRGIGIYGNQLFDDYSLQLVMPEGNKVKTIITSSSLKYFLHKVKSNMHNFCNFARFFRQSGSHL